MHRWKILFALACAAALVACGNDPEKTTPTTDTTTADTVADTAPTDTTTTDTTTTDTTTADTGAETAEDVAPGTDAVAETAEDVVPGTDAVAETVEDVIPGTDAATVDTAPVGKTHTVVTSGFAFDPPELTIAVGDSVEFKPGPTHTATQVEKATWDADGATPLVGGFNIVNPATGTVKFDQAGDVYYVCVPHASGGMKGKIIVK